MVDHQVFTGFKRNLKNAFEEESQLVNRSQDLDTRLRKKFKVDQEVKITLTRLEPSMFTLSSTLNKLDESKPLHDASAIEKKSRLKVLSWKCENSGDDNDSDELSIMPSSASAKSQSEPVGWFCKKCNRVITCTRELFEEHEKAHKMLLPYECRMKKCNAAFKNQEDLKAHVNEHKKSFKNHCEECGRAFRRPDGLREHLKKSHRDRFSVDFKYKCDICGMGWDFLTQFQRHGSKHSSEKPYKCDLCSMKFKSYNGQKYHMNIHFGILPYKCQACPERFVNRGKLERHYAIHHNNGSKPFKCDHCNSTFMLYEQFRRHKIKNACGDAAQIKPKV